MNPATQQLAQVQQASVARSHALVLYRRIAQCLECVELGHLGTAKAILTMTELDFKALKDCLPDLNSDLPKPAVLVPFVHATRPIDF